MCAGCGTRTGDPMLVVAEEMHRNRRELRLLALAMAFVFCVSLAIALAWFVRRDHAESLKVIAPPTAPRQDSTAPEATTPSARQTPTVPETSSEPSASSSSANRTTRPSTTDSSAIDVQSVQNAVKNLRSGSGKGEAATSGNNAPSSASDRYPGSEPLDVKDAAVPDVGIPVASQVYATTDSVSKVMEYYKQLYPDAQVMEISGQNIIAVDRPGETKVIAVGSGEGGTRIAIVRPE